MIRKIYHNLCTYNWNICVSYYNSTCRAVEIIVDVKSITLFIVIIFYVIFYVMFFGQIMCAYVNINAVYII